MKTMLKMLQEESIELSEILKYKLKYMNTFVYKL